MSKSDENEIYLSSSPHFSDKSSTSGIMLGVIIALLPLCVYGVILFGYSALVTLIVSNSIYFVTPHGSSGQRSIALCFRKECFFKWQQNRKLQ